MKHHKCYNSAAFFRLSSYPIGHFYNKNEKRPVLLDKINDFL